MIETRMSLIQRVYDPDDGESWREFVELYEPLLLAYVRKRGLNENDARDVVQEVLAKLLGGIQKYDRSRGRFRTWLWKVMYNAMVDLRRREGRIAGAEDEYREGLDVEVPAEDPHWEQDYRRRVLGFVMQRVKAATNPKAWACFEGQLLQGRPAREVATELQMTTNAVYVSTSRVLADVRQQCDSYEEELADV